MGKQKRQAIKTIHTLMQKPKWWNEAFAKYDQKRLYAWAAEQQADMLKPRSLRPQIPHTSFTDTIIMRGYYQPHIVKSKFLLAL